ncbi:MAG: hypothetical protein ACI35W_00685 [Anaeroplasmataceae bacterium]
MKKIKEDEFFQRRIELLKKYYPVDEQNKIITIKLHYNSVYDLLDYQVGDDQCKMFNEEFLEKITSIFQKIPSGYKADIILEIDDYDVYSPKDIMGKFNDLLELISYDVVKKSKNNRLISAILILIGMIILLINTLLYEHNIYGPKEELEAVILQEFFDITSWVFIWQAVTMLFLSPSNKALQIVIITKMLNKFSLMKNGEIVQTETKDAILEKSKLDSHRLKVKKTLLLITSTTLIFFGLVYITRLFNTSAWVTDSEYQKYLVTSNIIQIVIGVIVLIIGIGGLSQYNNRNFKLKFDTEVSIAIFILLFIFWIFSLVFIRPYNINMVIKLTFIVVAYIGYLISCKK